MSSTQYLSASEAAKIAGCTPQHVTRLCREGRIKGAVQMVRDWAIPKREAERLRDEYDPDGRGKPRKFAV